MLILGKHAEEHKGLVCVSEADVQKHCVVIGQSGSGKSFFIARYLEELALRTKARVIVLDPNGDFSNFWKPRESRFWEHGAFADSLRSLSSFATKQGIASYDNEEYFVNAWKDLHFQFVLAGQKDRTPIKEGVYGSTRGNTRNDVRESHSICRPGSAGCRLA